MKTKLLLSLVALAGIASVLYVSIIPKKQPAITKANVSEVNFDGVLLKLGDEFYFKPKDPCVADVKAKLSYLDEGTISLSILEEQKFDRKYYPRDPADISWVKIENNACIQGYSLCEVSVYSYCFTLYKKADPYILTYKIESKSTAPVLNKNGSIPNEKEIIDLFPTYKENLLKKHNLAGIADLGHMRVTKMEGLPAGVYVVEYVYLGEGNRTIPTEGGFTLAGEVNGKILIAEPGDLNYCRWIKSATLSESDRAYMGQDCPE